MKNGSNAKNAFVNENKAASGGLPKGVGKNGSRKIGKMDNGQSAIIVTLLEAKNVTFQEKSETELNFKITTKSIFNKKPSRIPRGKVETIHFCYRGRCG